LIPGLCGVSERVELRGFPVRRFFQSDAVSTVAAISVGAVVLGLVFWSARGTDPMWAIISFVLVYDSDARAAASAGLSRLALTILGSALALAAVFALGLHKWVLPASLAVTAVVCTGFLRSRAGWRIVLVTVALIVGSSLLQPELGPYIAVTRSVEVACGSALAIGFSWIVSRWIVGESGRVETRKESTGPGQV
jgi:uncharacterized membrane protein YccC